MRRLVFVEYTTRPKESPTLYTDAKLKTIANRRQCDAGDTVFILLEERPARVMVALSKAPDDKRHAPCCITHAAASQGYGPVGPTDGNIFGGPHSWEYLV